MAFLFGLLLALAALALFLPLWDRLESAFSRATAAVTAPGKGGRRPVWHPEGVEVLLREAGYERLTPLAFYAICAAGAVAGALLGNLIAPGVVVVLLAGAVGGVLFPFNLMAGRAERRARERRQQLAEAIETMRGLMKVGYGLERALEFLANEGPPLMRPAMRRAAAALRTGGLRVALEELRGQLASYDGDRLALSLAAAAAYGGRNTGDVLDNLARAVRDDLLVRQEAEAEMARQVLAARIIGGMPIVVLAAMFRFSSDYAAVYREPLGQSVLAAVFACIVLGYILMRRAMQLPKEGRLVMDLAVEGEA
jgi:tight adherence protein B